MSELIRTDNILVLSATKMELPTLPSSIKTHCVGVGKKRAFANTEEYIKKYNPEYIILVGLAGGVDPEMKNGDIFIPETILDYENPDFIYKVEFPIYRSGTLVTVPKIFWKKDKYELSQKLPYATAVDMEASSIAQVARKYKVNLVCIKGISDNIDFNLKDLKKLKITIKTAIETYTEYLLRLLTEKFHITE